MTRQEIFDTVADGLLAQAKTCYRARTQPYNGKAIAYRGDNNCKCAGGFLIPDILYKKEMEGHLFNDQLFDGVRKHRSIRPEDNDLITHLQWIHDGCKPDVWREELAALGKKFDLDISQIWPRSNPDPVSKTSKEYRP